MFRKSVCHWCHVMAHESFEDDEIAGLLNKYFVPVKVDREERPDVDMVYMSVCQAMTGQGGWPMTIIMTPEKKPFFAGTYLPRTSGYGMTGLDRLLSGVAKMWNQDKDQLMRFGDQIVSALNTKTPRDTDASPSWELVEKGCHELRQAFDQKYGGFGRAPKFPSPHNLLFLLMLYGVKNRDEALLMAEKTLISMARGGIHDQIGGGFSRYSTDDLWLVPHFEKMLYDNGLLALAYEEGYRLTRRVYFRQTAEGILNYVDRELTSAEGGFYCGQDADSQGVEGKYYVFSRSEIRNVLGEEEQKKFCRWYGITEEGNFQGRNIPNLIGNHSFEDWDSSLDKLCRKVYHYRLKRTPLHTDDKILTSWNSLMIMAYAKAGQLFDRAAFLEKAIRAQEFIEKHLVDDNDRLLVRYRQGDSAFSGNLDDYAYYCLALLTLYEVTLEADYLALAVHRAHQMADLFWDEEDGGFYFYGRDAQELIHRPKEIYDGAMPSGNSAAAHVLLKLSRLTAAPEWIGLADRQIRFLTAGVMNDPSAHCFSLMAFISALSNQKELVCASKENTIPQELTAFMREQGSDRISILFKCPANEERLARTAPFTREYVIPDQGVQYYLCENHVCGLPFSSLAGKDKKLM